MMMWNTIFHLLYIFTVPFIIIPRSAVSYSDSSEDSSDEEHSCTRLYKRCMRPGIPSNPVCGTDGKTYSHVCRLYYTNCWLYDDRILRKAYDGPCIAPTWPRPRLPPPRPPPPRPSPPRSPPPRPPVTSQPLPPPGPPPLPPTTRDPIAEATPSKCDFLCPETGPNMMVCGSDGVTYLSECYLEWLNCRRGTQITVAYPGPCLDFGTLAPIPPLRPTIGPTVVDGNGGALPGIGVGNPTNGVPTPPCSQYCPLESDPVCGTDGITYISPCLLEVQACVKRDPGLKIWYRGVCDETQSKHSGTERPCPRLETCPLLYLPVCGSDGITYQTECHLLAKACSSQDPRDRGLQVSFVGECSDLNTPSFCGTCSEIWQPVCGFDNVTYYSECHLRQYACENNLIYLKVAYRSICKAGLIECPDYCPIGVNDPVCGTDGNTYPSLCFLAHAACINNDKMLTLKHRGECSTDPCERKCPEDVYQPVCSSAGDTYQNDCFLWVAMCRDNSISRAGPSDGTCNLAIP